MTTQELMDRAELKDLADLYSKVEGKWYIKRRRTTFLISDRHELNG